MNSSVRVGAAISVTVDTMFEEGMVVSYTDSTGQEFRGALLTQPLIEQRAQKHMSTSQDLANPLSYIHDHPYSKLQTYARHICKKVPRDVLLNWSSHPIAAAETKSLEQIASRHKEAELLLLRGKDLQVSKPQIRSATILTDPIKETISNRRNIPAVSGRLAKKAANFKIIHNLHDNDGESSSMSENQKRHRKFKSSKSQSKKVMKKQRTPHKTPPNGTKRQCSRAKINLKDFSIPVTRVGVLRSESPNITSSRHTVSPLSCNSADAFSPDTSPVVIVVD